MLTLKGLSEQYSEDELQSMIDEALEYIEFAAEISITPQKHVDIEKFIGEKHLLKYYPVLTIDKIGINGETIEDYEIDKEAGIIYFNKHYRGFLKVEYTVGLSEEDIQRYVNPLLRKLVIYNLNNDITRDATSFKEGEVSITVDPTLTEGAVINQMINNLKNRFSCKVDLI